MTEHVFDRQAWAKMTIFEQMGNIGSEVGRALSAKRQGNIERMTTAFLRGIDLIDATVEDLATKNNRSHRIHELLRAKEQFSEAILTDKDDKGLEQYFMYFALAAQSAKSRQG